DARARVERVDLPYGLGVEPGTAVGQVVTGDTRDRRVLEAHLAHRLRDPPGLVTVERGRLARVDLAEVAATRALGATGEERRLAVLPALVDVGAAGFLAHRVEPARAHEVLELGVLRAHRRAGLDPARLLLDRDGGVARLDPQHAAALGCDRHVLSWVLRDGGP